MKKNEQNFLSLFELFTDYNKKNENQLSVFNKIFYNNNNFFSIINKAKQIKIKFKSNIKLNPQKIEEKELSMLINSFGNYKNNIQEISIIYTFTKNNNKKLRIFGDKFVENNKKKCRLIINGEQKKMQAFISCKEIDYKNRFKIRINNINDNNIRSFSRMFDKCSSLLLLKFKSKWNTNNVNNISEMFSNCISLKELSDISKWNTNNVNDMGDIFKL